MTTTTLRYLIIKMKDSGDNNDGNHNVNNRWTDSNLDLDVLYQALEETTFLKGICLPVSTPQQWRQFCRRLPSMKSLSSLHVVAGPSMVRQDDDDDNSNSNNRKKLDPLFDREMVDAVQQNTNLYQFQCSTKMSDHTNGVLSSDGKEKVLWHLRCNKLIISSEPIPKSCWPNVLHVNQKHHLYNWIMKLDKFETERLVPTQRYHLLRNVLGLANHVAEITTRRMDDKEKTPSIRSSPPPPCETNKKQGLFSSNNGLFSLLVLTSVLVTVDRRQV